MMEIGRLNRGLENERKEQANGMICEWSHVKGWSGAS